MSSDVSKNVERLIVRYLDAPVRGIFIHSLSFGRVSGEFRLLQADHIAELYSFGLVRQSKEDYRYRT